MKMLILLAPLLSIASDGTIQVRPAEERAAENEAILPEYRTTHPTEEIQFVKLSEYEMRKTIQEHIIICHNPKKLDEFYESEWQRLSKRMNHILAVKYLKDGKYLNRSLDNKKYYIDGFLEFDAPPAMHIRLLSAAIDETKTKKDKHSKKLTQYLRGKIAKIKKNRNQSPPSPEQPAVDPLRKSKRRSIKRSFLNLVHENGESRVYQDKIIDLTKENHQDLPKPKKKKRKIAIKQDRPAEEGPTVEEPTNEHFVRRSVRPRSKRKFLELGHNKSGDTRVYQNR